MGFATAAAVATDTFAPVSVPLDDGLHAVRGEIAAVLSMRHNGPRPVRLRYELVGRGDAPVVVLAGGISAHRHVSANAEFPEKGWAEGLVAAGRALDPAVQRILAFDFIGADGALDLPIDTADQADALALLLDHLGIPQLQCFVGYSYGALVGQQFAIRHRQRLLKLVAVSGAHRPHPYAAAWRALQRRAVALGQLQCAESHGLALARQFAMLSYRTPEEFGERFDAPPEVVNGRVRVAAEDYWMPQARSTPRAPRWMPTCACPNRSTCIASTRPPSWCRPSWWPWKATAWCRWPTASAWSKGWVRAAACACCARPTGTTPSSKKPIASTRSSPTPSVPWEKPHEPVHRYRAVL